MSHKSEMVTGVAYTAISKYAWMVIQLVIQGVLGRLVIPSDHGVMAIAMVAMAFFAIFTDMGLGPAIIQHKDIPRGDMDRLFSFTCWSGLALAGTFFAFSPAMASFYAMPKLEPMAMMLSASLLFASINIVPNALMFKDKKFKFMAWRQLLVQTFAGAVAVGLALWLPAEYKIYSLASQNILSAIIIFAVNFRQYPLRLRFTFGISALRPIFGYSAYQFFFGFINYFSRNLDKLVTGKVLGSTILGYYDKSYRLMLLPLQNLTSVITPVMHPIFSEMRDRRIMMNNYMKVFRLLALIGFPLSVLLFFSDRELVLLIYGMQWAPSVPAFRILAISVGVQMVLSSSGSIFQAAGDTRTLFIVGLSSTLLNVAGVVAALTIYRTIEAVAWTVSACYTLNLFICYVMMYRVTFKLEMSGFWRQFVSPLTLAAITLAALYPTRMLPGDMNMILSLGIKCAIAGVIWPVYIQLSGAFDITGRVRSLIKNRR